MLLTAYSSDAVYLYSTYDEPGSVNLALPNSPSIPSPRPVDDKEATEHVSGDEGETLVASLRVDNIFGNPPTAMEEEGDVDDDDNYDGVDDDEELRASIIIDEATVSHADFLPDVPVVLPRMRYRGAQNVETVKDGRPAIECPVSE